MATEGAQPLKFTLKAGAAVLQYRFLQVDSGGDVIHATAEGQKPAGVSQDDTADAAGKPVEIAGYNGVTKITASAALSKGDFVAPGTAGKAAAAGAAGTEYWGVILEASTADGDIVKMLLIHGTV